MSFWTPACAGVTVIWLGKMSLTGLRVWLKHVLFGSASNYFQIDADPLLTSALASTAPGHDQPVTLSPDRTPEGLLHFETCRKGNSGSSAIAVGGICTVERLEFPRLLTLARQFLQTEVFVTSLDGIRAEVKYHRQSRWLDLLAPQRRLQNR